jgi:chemotaxis protein MotB
MATLARRERRTTNIWPGFVDALATLLMVVIFLLMVFVLAQFFLSNALSGRDTALKRLQGQVEELADLLALERKAGDDLSSNVSLLSAKLQASMRARDDLNAVVHSLTERSENAEAQVTELRGALAESSATIKGGEETIKAQVQQLTKLANDIAALQALKEELEREAASITAKAEKSESALIEERKISESARAQIALLNQQTAALREQLQQLTTILADAEEKAREQEVQIASLGQRLNAALASKVQELSRYRSEFFGRLRDVLDEHPDVRIVGDRFVFQSEVLFETGSAELGDEGRAQLIRVANTLKEISEKIPAEIDWILRVDGHTDKVPIDTILYPSNWELSAARAISVVRLFIEQGIPPERLTAAGFGEFQAIDSRESEEAYRRNRRIELKLTQR